MCRSCWRIVSKARARCTGKTSTPTGVSACSAFWSSKARSPRPGPASVPMTSPSCWTMTRSDLPLSRAFAVLVFRDRFKAVDGHRRNIVLGTSQAARDGLRVADDPIHLVAILIQDLARDGVRADFERKRLGHIGIGTGCLGHELQPGVVVVLGDAQRLADQFDIGAPIRLGIRRELPRIECLSGLKVRDGRWRGGRRWVCSRCCYASAIRRRSRCQGQHEYDHADKQNAEADATEQQKLQELHEDLPYGQCPPGHGGYGPTALASADQALPGG